MASGEMCMNNQSASKCGKVTDKTDCKETSTTTITLTNGGPKQHSRPKSPRKVLIRKNTPVMLPTIAKINAKEKFNTKELVEGDEDAALEEERQNREKHAIFLANQNQVISSVRVVVSCDGQSQENVEISNEVDAEKLKEGT